MKTSLTASAFRMMSSQNLRRMLGEYIDEDSVHETNSLIFSRGMRKLNSVNFLMQTDDSTKQAIFDSVCEQRIQVDLLSHDL